MEWGKALRRLLESIGREMKEIGPDWHFGWTSRIFFSLTLSTLFSCFFFPKSSRDESNQAAASTQPPLSNEVAAVPPPVKSMAAAEIPTPPVASNVEKKEEEELKANGDGIAT